MKTFNLFFCIIVFFISHLVFADNTNQCLRHMHKHVINPYTVWLDECNLSDKDIPRLVTYLKDHPSVSQLYLLNNHISDEGAVLLSKVKTLKMVELRNNLISSRGAVALSKGSIHMLDLKGNKLSSVNLVTLAQNNKLQNDVIILG